MHRSNWTAYTTKIHFLRALACGLCFALAAGCSTVKIGSAFDLESFQKNVERGVTTRDQVQAWLGAPPSRGVAVELNGEKFERWTYFHVEGELPSMSASKWRNLEVKFDSNGVVRAYSWSSNP
jgi:outer membrane protein assembly factor BamE (lipoprotein component of BamABCDE complex)